MKNSYLDNKIILKYCKDYYKIINEEFSESDIMSDKIIQLFQSYLFSTNVNDRDRMKTLPNINNAILRYFDDREFRKVLNNLLMGLKVSKSEKDVVGFICNKIIDEYNKYLEGYTRNLYIPRWI